MTTHQFRSSVGGANRSAFMRHLAAEAPIYRDDAGFWVVSRHEHVRSMLRNHTLLSSQIMDDGYPLLTDDPPRHTALRGLVNKAFTPAGITGRQPVVEKITRELVAAIPESEEIDIIDALASRLPVTVIAQMLGVPEGDRERFKRWSATGTSQEGRVTREVRTETMLELRAYLKDIVEQRRSAPDDDLISKLVHASEQGVRLSDSDVVGFSILLLVAGNETTTTLIGNVLHRLSHEPWVWERLRSDPQLAGDVIEETLRLDAPVQFLVRRAVEEIQVEEHTICAGDTVVLYLAAANRDPEVWEAPEVFDPWRERKRHLAFGYGIHHCIGVPLARLETETAVRVLAERFLSITPGLGQKTRIGSGLFFGFSRLPLIFG